MDKTKVQHVSDYCIILGKLLAELEADVRITWLSVL